MPGMQEGFPKEGMFKLRFEGSVAVSQVREKLG